MNDLLAFIVKLVLWLIGIFLAYRIFLIVRDIVGLAKRRKAADELRQKLDVFSVESEVLGFTSTRLSKLDTLYNVSVSYSVDSRIYYKDVVMYNRGSLRVGQNITLLCDNDDLDNAVVQNGDEEDALKRMIFRLITLIVWLIIDFVSSFLDWNKMINDIEYMGVQAGVTFFIVFTLNKIIDKIIERKSK